jgi:hypothetical protein
VRNGAVTGVARLLRLLGGRRNNGLGLSRRSGRLTGLSLGGRSRRLLRLSGLLRGLGLLRLLGGSGSLGLLGSRRRHRLGLSRRGRRLLIARLSVSGRSGRLLRLSGLLGGLGLLRLLGGSGSLRLAGLLAATSGLDGADGGRDGNGLSDNDRSSTSGGAVGDLGTARGDGLDVGRVDGRGGHRSLGGGGSLRGLSGSRNLRNLLAGLVALLGRGDLGRRNRVRVGNLGGNGIRGGADDGRSSRAVGHLRTARSDGDSLGLVDLGNLIVGNGTRGQESSGGERVTHLEELVESW